jgi:hypothetical protein
MKFLEKWGGQRKFHVMPEKYFILWVPALNEICPAYSEICPALNEIRPA